MKKIIFITITFLSIAINTMSQSWQWSSHAGGRATDGAYKIITDKNGNSYISGNYTSDTCYFNSDTLYKICSTMGCDQYFLAKYNSTGSELWVKGMDGSTQDNLYISTNMIAYDSINNFIYLAGAFTGSGRIGGVYLSTTYNVFDMILAKFDTNGNCIWATKAEAGNADCWAYVVAIDQNGNIVVGGQANSSPTFDTIAIPAGFFLAKFDSSGHCQWAKKKFNNNTNIYGVDALLFQLKIMNNDIFAIGNSTVASFTVDTVTVIPNFSSNQYIIARFDSSGTAKWMKPCSGTSDLEVGDIIVDTNDNSYITGMFFHTGIFQNDTLTNSGSKDLFLAKYNSSGNPVWVRQANTSYIAGGHGLSFCYNGFYLIGGFIGNASFGSNTLGSSTLGDMIVARYDTSGNCIGVIQVANSGGGSISTDPAGSFYATGSFNDTATFNAPIISRGYNNIFIAKSTAITGIEEEGRLANNQLVIYANPTAGICNASIPDEFKNEKNLTLQIFDNTGKLLQQMPVQMNDEKVSLNLEEEAKGIYNVVLSNGKKSYQGKIVFE